MGETYEATKKLARAREAREQAAFALSWRTVAGKDGSIHCRPVGDAPRHMRPVGREWRLDPKAVREMERQRAGRMKGVFGGEETHAPAVELEPPRDAEKGRDKNPRAAARGTGAWARERPARSGGRT